MFSENGNILGSILTSTITGTLSQELGFIFFGYQGENIVQGVAKHGGASPRATAEFHKRSFNIEEIKNQYEKAKTALALVTNVSLYLIIVWYQIENSLQF